MAGSLEHGSYIGRFCAIDIGTVTCRMLVSDAYSSHGGGIELRELDKEYEIVNLGEGVDATHRLSPTALSRTSDALGRFAKVRADFGDPDHPIVSTMAIATSATRDAENAEELEQLLDSFGVELRVIPGSTEAALSFSGASSQFSGEKVAVVDVGGGSTEVSIGMAGQAPEYSRSFDIGSRRITERFWDGYPPSSAALKDAREWAAEVLAEVPEDQCAGLQRVIAVAGTATTVVTIILGMDVYDSSRVNGFEVSMDKLEEVTKHLSLLSQDQMTEVHGLDPRRGPVIVGGLLILEEALRVLGAGSYTASETDILEGIVMYNARKYQQENA